MTPPKSETVWTGVILAAGRARRFGSPKQLAVWPKTGTPLVCSAFDAIAPACSRMIVVVAHDAPAVTAALGKRAFTAVAADPDAPMFESVRAGLSAAHAPGSGGVILQPADHPGLLPQTLRQLLQTARTNPKNAVMPEYQGRGGHPALIPSALIPGILAYGVGSPGTELEFAL